MKKKLFLITCCKNQNLGQLLPINLVYASFNCSDITWKQKLSMSAFFTFVVNIKSEHRQLEDILAVQICISIKNTEQ